MRLSIFRVRSLLTANLVMFLAASGIFAMFFFNTLYIQRVLGYGPLKAGSPSFRSPPGSWSRPGSRRSFAPKIGVRPVAAVGMVVTIVGMLLLARLPVRRLLRDRRPPVAHPHLTRHGRGVHAADPIATTGLEDEDQGLASGLFNTSQQIGGALGLAILSTLAASQTRPPAAATTRRHS